MNEEEEEEKKNTNKYWSVYFINYNLSNKFFVRFYFYFTYPEEENWETS